MIVQVITFLFLCTEVCAEKDTEENYAKLAEKIHHLTVEVERVTEDNHHLWEANKQLQKVVGELTASEYFEKVIILAYCVYCKTI